MVSCGKCSTGRLLTASEDHMTDMLQTVSALLSSADWLWLLVHCHVTIIFVVSVCLFVCLFVQSFFLSRL